MLYDKKHIYLRSPLRVSFVGGGTDLESYYSQGTPGHVVSAAIDLYVYVSLKDMFDANVRVHHAEIETEPITSRIRHAYIRTALEHFGLFRGVEAVLTSDVMTTGSGLGASSSTMSALVKGCSLLRTDNVVEDKHKLAELTYQLEQSAGTIGGKQDQYAVAFGGLNSIVFHEKEVTVSPVKISRSRLKEFEERLFLVFTNLARDSRNIQINLEQNVKTNDRKKHFDSLQNLSHEFLNIIESEHGDLNDLGKLLHEGWMLKKSTNRESTNPYIEQLYDTLMAKGILGGKILGAGGGGFILAFVSDPGLKEKIKYELYPNFIALDVKFNFKGTEVLWKNF
jgi:D-glycero-alpha-D-manno-heptose-7-phosphate kinase